MNRNKFWADLAKVVGGAVLAFLAQFFGVGF